MHRTRIATAGWSIARAAADDFPTDGSGLERYAARFGAVEINSSFHRPHRISTWERWRESVPDDFRFSVKLPRQITHELRLVGVAETLSVFMEEVGTLGEKLGVLLVQLPPKLAFDPAVAKTFFSDIANRTETALACEPRHATWFTDEAGSLLQEMRVARVAADPIRHDGAGQPAGWRGLSYWRLHGSPVIYRSSYADRVETLAAALREETKTGRDTWCVFDNTASSAATLDALALDRVLACRARDW
ncbi:DUF72 domain-containing protein [Tsuneonella sp. HG249]